MSIKRTPHHKDITMYFPLEINEQLASAMRAAAEFKVEVEKIIECVCVDENGETVDDKNDYYHVHVSNARFGKRERDVSGCH